MSERKTFGGSSGEDPDEEQRRRDEAARKFEKTRGLLPKPEVRRFDSIEEFLRLSQPEKPEDGPGNKSAE